MVFRAASLRQLAAAGHRHEVEHDLGLLDAPPDAVAPSAETRLSDLPVVVLDTETTGLDVANDSIVSIGAVRLHGARLFRNRVFETLVKPGRPIPRSSTAIHGIGDAMVKDAPNLAAAWMSLAPMLANCAVVGHNIGFDLALLKREVEAAGSPWVEPPSLDTVKLASALEPNERDLNLESVARRLGVEHKGRHTALGDSLMTAEVYLRLLPRLAAIGVATLGRAQAFGESAKLVSAAQKGAGWGRKPAPAPGDGA
jgi:DNA polymerase-3 subunit epsilon